MKWYKSLLKQKIDFLAILVTLLFGLSMTFPIASISTLGLSPVEATGVVTAEPDSITSNEETGNPLPGEPYQMHGTGETFRLQAGNNWMIRTQFGLQLNFSLRLQAELSVMENTSNLAGPLPNGSYSFGYYYHFELNNSYALENATLGMSYNPGEYTCDNCVCDDCLHFAFYNTSTNQWQNTYSWMNKEQHMVYTTTNHFSTWTILVNSSSNAAGPQPGVPFQLQNNGTAVRIQAGNNWMFRTQSGFQLNLSIGDPVEFSINETDTDPIHPLPAGVLNMSKFMHIEINNTNTRLNATFCLEYNQSWLGTKDPARLRFAFYNTSTNQWQYTYSWAHAENGKVYVYTNTTHFSTWSAVYVLPASGSLSSNSSTPVSGFELLPFMIASMGVAIGFLVIKKRKTER